MAPLNKTKYAIMALLSEEPRTGYDIKKAIETEEIYYWSESYGQIYPILHRLAAEGLAVKRKSPTQRHSNRTVYELTPEGHRELVEWLKRPAETTPMRIEILLKLRFGHLCDPASTIDIVNDYRDGQLKDIALLEKQLEKHTDGGQRELYSRFTVNYGIQLKRALVNWAETTIEELRKLSAAEAPRDTGKG